MLFVSLIFNFNKPVFYAFCVLCFLCPLSSWSFFNQKEGILKGSHTKEKIITLIFSKPYLLGPFLIEKKGSSMRSQAAHTARAANRRFEKELLSFLLYVKEKRKASHRILLSYAKEKIKASHTSLIFSFVCEPFSIPSF